MISTNGSRSENDAAATSDVLWPKSVPDHEETRQYLASLRHGFPYRTGDHVGKNGFFSTGAARHVFEQEFLKAGAVIRAENNNLNRYARPLGNRVMENFGFGALMGLMVGGVVVYQILFADVSEHLAEYATLKAMGYTNRALSRLVLQEAAILAGLGFLPGFAITLALYRVTAEATRLPMEMTPGRSLAVLLVTFVMCAAAALAALRKLHGTDPAEIFG